MDDDEPERRRRLVIGAVLCGGASLRMGRDKATLRGANGRVLAAVAADAMRDAGILDVMFVGGDPDALAGAGLAPVVADRWPGDGPLGAVVTAWAAAGEATEILVVLACDLPNVTPTAVTTVLAGLGDHDAAIARTTDGRRHPLLAAYRRTAVAPMAASFAAGVRSMVEALGNLAVAEVGLADDTWAHNANTPVDL